MFRKQNWFCCPSGVPQGSDLVPMLFLLFINDITDIMRSSSILPYADDTKLFRPILTIEDTVALQRDLDSLAAGVGKISCL